MAVDGEITIRKVLPLPTIATSGTLVIPASPFTQCCAEDVLNVLADTSGDALRNDQSTVIWWFPAIATGATLLLKKWVNGVWTTAATISDNTYGTYGAFGYFVNNEGQKFISLQIDWSKVLAVKGEGSYKVTCNSVIPILGNQSNDSYEFCLKTYSSILAEGTIRLEYWMNGITEDIANDTLIKDFGNQNIYNAFRLVGFFGYPKDSYKEEDVEYQNGQNLFVEDKRFPIFTCTLKQLPEFIHTVLRTDFMMADKRAVTDYNSKNNASYIQKFVNKESGYEPDYDELQSNLSSVELKFRPMINRSRKLRN